MSSSVIVYQYRIELSDFDKKSCPDQVSTPKSPGILLTPICHSLNDVSESVLRNQLTRRLLNGAHLNECGTMGTIQLPSDEGESGLYSIVINTENENENEHYVVAIIHDKKSVLEAFLSELDNFCLTTVKPSLCQGYDDKKVMKLVSSWPQHTTEPLSRGVLLLRAILGDVLAIAFINGRLDLSAVSTEAADCVERVFDIATVFRRQEDSTKLLEKTFTLKPSTEDAERLAIARRPLGGDVAFFQKVAADLVEAAETADVTHVKNLFQNFHVKTAHETNTVKRLVDQARDSYYALYRLLLFTESDRESRLSLLQCFIHMPDAFNEEERNIITLLRNFSLESVPLSVS